MADLIPMKTLTILGQQFEIVDEQARADAAGSVKTINGVGPDENGNVVVAAGDGSGLVLLDPEPGEVFTVIVPEPTLTGITASYTGGDVVIGTALSALVGIVVTASYSDGTTKTVTDYTLSGSIADGSNTITVTYEGMTATFTVTGVEEEPEVTLSSISATYTGGNVAVGTAVTDLTGITVTAHYSDGSTAPVTGYTLSGEIAEGSNTITVSYGGKTTTFVVIGEAEEDSGLTDEELAALDAMPDAYLSDDGKYLYLNPAKCLGGDKLVYYTMDSYIGENHLRAKMPCAVANTYEQLDFSGENVFNGLIPYAGENYSNAGFIGDEDIPALCYTHLEDGAFAIRDSIENRDTYIDNGDFGKRLYDSFRRIPIKTSDKLRVFEVTDEVLATFTRTPDTAVNEYGMYYSFVTTSLGGGLGAWTNDRVISSVGGLYTHNTPTDQSVEHFRCAGGLNRFYFCIPQEKIPNLTLDSLKAYIKTLNLKFFYIADEAAE